MSHGSSQGALTGAGGESVSKHAEGADCNCVHSLWFMMGSLELVWVTMEKEREKRWWAWHRYDEGGVGCREELVLKIQYVQ